MKIIKRDGREVPYDYRKIKSAIEAANGEVAEENRLSDTEVGFIVGGIQQRCEALGRSIGVEEIQDMVIDELQKSEHYRLALHYSEYCPDQDGDSQHQYDLGAKHDEDQCE